VAGGVETMEDLDRGRRDEHHRISMRWNGRG
jgi:hypothetical protein